jgi:succinate dehydrogenase / fumarate reductase flavoprotein subunit
VRHGPHRGASRSPREIPKLREEFWSNVNVTGSAATFNQSLEKAGRVADYLEFGELMCPRRAGARRVVRRSLPRGVPDEGEAKRDDDELRYVAAWEYAGEATGPTSTRSRSTSNTCTFKAATSKELQEP